MPWYGLYQVIKHHTNGTITYEKEPFVNDKVNIRRAEPYYQKNGAQNQRKKYGIKYDYQQTEQEVFE